jgi:nicotinate-nucleotide adenylyltransferase
MQIAVYSGSFNPVHNGHIAIAKAALNEGYDEVWLIVSPKNPHKKERDLWPFEDRIYMAELAVADQPRIKVSDCENLLPRPSYTINTLEFLQKSWPENKFRLLIGEDNLVNFHLWKNYRLILESFGLIVYPRASQPLRQVGFDQYISKMKAPLLDVSSSEIRKRLTDNASIHNLVPHSVEKYILEKLRKGNPDSGF